MLNFSGETVKIAGQNLNAEARPNVRLFAGILLHRVRPTRAERPQVVIAAVDRDDRQTAGLAKTIGRDARRSRHGQHSKVGRYTYRVFLNLFTALANVGREPSQVRRDACWR